MDHSILETSPILPVVVIQSSADALPLAEALLNGGLKAIEVTFRTEAAADAIAAIRKDFPEMVVSAGTVVTPEQARRAIDSGAQFGLAPGFDPDTVSVFHQAGLPFVPGIMSPSDIQSAYKAGCSHLKFFPAEAAGGVRLLKSLAAPFKSLGIRFCPTGGLNPSNAKTYLEMSEVFAIGGTWIAKPQQIADQEWSTIAQQTRDALILC